MFGRYKRRFGFRRGGGRSRGLSENRVLSIVRQSNRRSKIYSKFKSKKLFKKFFVVAGILVLGFLGWKNKDRLTALLGVKK